MHQASRDRSGTEAAVSTEGRHVGRLVEEPDSFPFVADLAEVFRIDQELFDSSWPVGCISWQRDRRAALAEDDAEPEQA
jgi:hypothetical protein